MVRTELRAAQVGLAGVSLGIGVAIYLLDRGGAAAFVPGWLAAELPVRRFFGGLAGSLPSFVHVFAFALLTAAVLPAAASPVRICAAWAGLDMLFELGQIESVSAALARGQPAWLPHSGLVEQMLSYFRFGTFDLADLGAIALGVLAAHAVITAMKNGEQME